ncbi:MAG: hypothetical protein SPJ65_00270 [Roseburia sp.]|nr:hypothetical protein [Roseburia sp.]
MIQTEKTGEYIRTYSDEHCKIRRNDGDIYYEAVDLANSGYSYEETNEKIEDYVEENAEDNTHDEAERLLNILVYGSEGGE